jgi:hypothetical protein
MAKGFSWFGFLLLLFLVFPSIVFSGDNTPTSGPSKTPTPAAPAEATSESTVMAPANTLEQPFTQSDLSVLTGNVQRPNGAVWFNSQLYVVCNGDWTLYQLNDTSGSTETYIYGVRNAHTLYAEGAQTGDLNLWVPDFETNSFLFVNRARAPQTVASNLQGPWGIAYLDENRFLITNLAGDNIAMVGRDGQVQIVLEGLRSPTGIAVDDSFVYVANNGSSRRSIEWIAKDALIAGDAPAPQPLVSGLVSTTGMVLGEDGYLYFTYAIGTRGVVGRVNPELCRESGCSMDQIEIVIYTELAAPLAGLTISPDMRLFFHTIFRPEVYWIQL